MKDIVKDPRFSNVHNDPRFKIPKRSNFKTKVDDRFSKEDLKGFGKKTKIDRYGRRLEKESQSNDFDKLYEKEEDDDEDEEEDRTPQVVDKARGEGLSSSESESEPEIESESEIEMEPDVEKPEEGDPSNRFAVVNMDWDNIRSVDLLATFTSFVPAGGKIENVAIYPSEFGKERMQIEEIEGPPRDVFQSKKKEDLSSDSESEPENLEKAAKKLYETDDGKEDYDSKALRKYQLQRLRYYYAVVSCDSIGTAKSIYDACDGTEFESTANHFDLRYIPDGMDFEDEARDECSKVPISYKPNQFTTDALQHSKVKLTWDETPNDRLQLSSKAFSQRDLDDMDLKAYLASDSEEEDEATIQKKYKSLTGGAEDSEGDVDMEISFTPGLSEAKPQVTEETTIESYRRKEKERRKRRLEKLKQKGEPSDEPVADEKDKVQEKKKMDKVDKEDSDEHFNMKDILKSEKAEKSKRKHKKGKKIDKEMLQDDFKPDLSDPRFQEVFENHEFAIDPTEPSFKKTKVMKQVLEERSKRRKKSRK